MSHSYESAEKVVDADGRLYHIGLKRGEVAPFILTCGDPSRAERIAKRFDRVDVSVQVREFTTFTGVMDGMPLTVMATGIGADNTEIATVELAQIVDDPTFIRVGTCGALQDDIQLEDLVISTGSVRLETTTTWFVHEGYPAVAHWQIVAALVKAAENLRKRFHVGVTATAPGFYGAQGRNVDHFPPRRPELPRELARMNVKNLEMETSALFTLATLAGFRSGAVCTAFARRGENVFVDADRKIPAEDSAIDVALEAFRLLRTEPAP